MAAQELLPNMDPELNRQLAEILAMAEALRFSCTDAIKARDRDETLSKQQEILDMIDAALDLLPKTIEQRIAELVVRQSRLNEVVKAETGDSATSAGQQAADGLDELRKLAAEARSNVLGGPPAQVAERIRTEQDRIHGETESVDEEMRQQIPTGTSGAAGATAPTPDGQSPQVQAYIEASKQLEPADFEMPVATESLEIAIVQNALRPMEADGLVQAAQATALEELVKALSALKPPEEQPQGDQKDEQDQQQQQEQEDQGSENARRALERADKKREEAERELYRRRPRTVIKDWYTICCPVDTG